MGTDTKECNKENLKRGGKYNWKHAPELLFMCTRHYVGDRRTWYQFELVSEPGKVWCEVLEDDLKMFEEIAE